ncbi:MAG: flavodoxin family protein [Lactobacillus sp.]|nr:flavodoxin family protein [Lactobacillus sp.]
MKVAVRYYSKSGSTKKLADAVATAVDTKAYSVETPITEPVDLLFIGGAPYIASQLDKHLRDFIHTLSYEQVKQIAVFSTSNWKMSIEPQTKRALRDDRIKVVDRGYMGRGALGVINESHPNAAECAAAAAYAKATVAKLAR